jgi:hypothetical protein
MEEKKKRTKKQIAAQKRATRAHMKVADWEIKEELWKNYGNVLAVAKKFEVDESAVYRRINKSRYLQEALKESRGKFVLDAERTIMQAVMKGNVDAAKFVLRSQGKERGWQEDSNSGNINLVIEAKNLIQKIDTNTLDLQQAENPGSIEKKAVQALPKTEQEG